MSHLQLKQGALTLNCVIYAPLANRRLKILCARAMALPVGRGMFTLSSAPPQITEALRLSPLTLKGRMPNAATVDLDTAQMPADHLLWPEFHNGVAAALRLAQENG